MLFQFFVNKCTHKIDTLYNTQQKKNTYTVDNFFGVIISIRQQQIIKNKRNIGPSISRNKGINIADNDLYNIGFITLNNNYCTYVPIPTTTKTVAPTSRTDAGTTPNSDTKSTNRTKTL